MGTEIDQQTGERRVSTATATPSIDHSPLTPSDLAALEGMDRGGLVALVRLCDAKRIRYAMLTRDEKRERLKLKIYSIAEDSENEATVIKAANDWLDREDGKAMQQIRQETTVTGAIAMIGKDEVAQIISDWLAKPETAITIEQH